MERKPLTLSDLMVEARTLHGVLIGPESSLPPRTPLLLILSNSLRSLASLLPHDPLPGRMEVAFLDADLEDATLLGLLLRVRAHHDTLPIVLLYRQITAKRLCSLLNHGITHALCTRTWKQQTPFIQMILDRAAEVKVRNWILERQAMALLELEAQMEDQESVGESKSPSPESKEMELLRRSFAALSAEELWKIAPHSLHQAAQGVAFELQRLNDLEEAEADWCDFLHPFLGLIGCVEEMEHFESIVHALRIIHDALRDASPRDVRMARAVLQGVCHSLKQWHRVLLMERSTPNAHYLDAALVADALALEAALLGRELETEEEGEGWELF